MEEVSYQNSHQSGGHHCKNLLIRCMDFRFHRELDKMLEELFRDEGGLGDYDSPGVGGGASKAVVDDASRPVVFSAIDIGIEKHQISRVLIVDHIDCGAYGGSSRFGSPEEEEKFHSGELKKAAVIIKKRYPQLEIKLFYQDWGTIKPVSA